MIEALLVLLAFQLAGEAITHASALPLPGPVLGLVLFAFALKMMPGLAEKVSGVAHGILRNLSLLFVPAGVGVVQQLPVVGAYGLALAAALIGSTVLTLIVTVYVFLFVKRLTGKASPRGDAP